MTLEAHDWTIWHCQPKTRKFIAATYRPRYALNGEVVTGFEFGLELGADLGLDFASLPPGTLGEDGPRGGLARTLCHLVRREPFAPECVSILHRGWRDLTLEVKS